MSRKKIGPNHFLHRSTSVMIFFIVFLGFQIVSYLMRHIMLRIQTHLHSMYVCLYSYLSSKKIVLFHLVFLKDIIDSHLIMIHCYLNCIVIYIIFALCMTVCNYVFPTNKYHEEKLYLLPTEFLF